MGSYLYQVIEKYIEIVGNLFHRKHLRKCLLRLFTDKSGGKCSFNTF